MKRRSFLIGVGGAVSLAGCSTITSVVESEEYEQNDKESMLPDEVGSDWPDQDLEADHSVNEHFDRVWVSPDDDLGVMMDVEIFDSIEAAENSFERSWATASDPGEYPLADEGMISDDGEAATCLFRHSNAIGQVLAIRMSGLEVRPDRNRAAEYADILYGGW